MATFERGFKSWAERVSASLRKDLKVSPQDPMPLEHLATYLGARLLTPNDIEGLPERVLDQLLEVDPEGWSAVTCLSGGRQTIIFNPSHAPQRQSSDIAHELSHLLIGHQPAQIVVSQSGNMCLRSYNEREEAEANWLAGALLLPRETLLLASQKGIPEDDLCKQYRVSRKMLSWRMAATGVALQARRAAAYRKRNQAES